MPDLAMSKGVRRRESLRPSILFNMVVEKDEEAPDGFARRSRPGLAVEATIGGGPNHGLYSKAGVFDGDRFAVSGSSLYRGTTNIGSISGTGPASMAASATELVVTRGTTAYSYLSSGLQAITFPDSANVRAVAYLGGYFIFVRDDSHRFYWSASGDGRTIDGLDFASAESSPDEVLDVRIVNDGVWFLGAETVEFWQLTGGADAPFARAVGILLKKGLIATGAACEADNTLFWWGHDHRIYRGSEGVPIGVSDNGIEEHLPGSTLKEMFSFSDNGATFVGVKTDTGTFIFDVGNGVWSEYGTFGRTGWRARNCTGFGTDQVFGDEVDGRLWRFDPDNWDDGDVLERGLSGGFPGAGAITVNMIALLANPGETGVLTGQGSDPTIEFRASRNSGKTWGAWRQAKLGAQGKYRQRVEKRRWGLFDRAGGLFEARVTDPVPFRVSRWFANEPSGGRGGNAA